MIHYNPFFPSAHASRVHTPQDLPTSRRVPAWSPSPHRLNLHRPLSDPWPQPQRFTLTVGVHTSPSYGPIVVYSPGFHLSSQVGLALQATRAKRHHPVLHTRSGQGPDQCSHFGVRCMPPTPNHTILSDLPTTPPQPPHHSLGLLASRPLSLSTPLSSQPAWLFMRADAALAEWPV